MRLFPGGKHADFEQKETEDAEFLPPRLRSLRSLLFNLFREAPSGFHSA